MKKRITSLVLVFTLLLSFCVNVSAASNDTKVSVATSTTYANQNGTASGYLTHATLPAGTYTVTLYNSDTYFYNVNVYKY